MDFNQNKIFIKVEYARIFRDIIEQIAAELTDSLYSTNDNNVNETGNNTILFEKWLFKLY